MTDIFGASFKKNKESRQGDRPLCAHLQKRTKVCKQAGHDPGSEFFDYYEEQDDNVLAFHGQKNVLSNFSTADINVNFGTSAKHAFQLTKALRNGVFNAAERIKSVSTALDAKRIEDTFRRNLTWET